MSHKRHIVLTLAGVIALSGVGGGAIAAVSSSGALASTTTVRASCNPTPLVSTDAKGNLSFSSRCKVPKPPAATVTATATATVTKTVTASPSPAQTSTAPTSTAPTSTAPTSTAPTSTAPTSATCTDANAFVDWNNRAYTFHDTSASVRSTSSWGAGGMGDYYADSGMWNVNNYNVDQYTTFCGPSSFYVRNTSDNSAADGAVKSYPNIHMDAEYQAAGAKPWPQYQTISSTFAHTSPGKVGIYDVAYDVWLNGLDIELMIWTENYRQTPSGSKVGTLTWEGTTWDVWATGSHDYLALVPVNGGIVTSGDFDLKALLTALNGKGLVATSAVLSQIDYGVEIVSSGGSPQRWDFSNISISLS